jgi:hypothetical protein
MLVQHPPGIQVPHQPGEPLPERLRRSRRERGAAWVPRRARRGRSGIRATENFGAVPVRTKLAQLGLGFEVGFGVVCFGCGVGSGSSLRVGFGLPSGIRLHSGVVMAAGLVCPQAVPDLPEMAGSGRMDTALARAWDQVGCRLPPADRLTHAGLEASLRDVDVRSVAPGHDPHPEHGAEAYFEPPSSSNPPRTG